MFLLRAAVLLSGVLLQLSAAQPPSRATDSAAAVQTTLFGEPFATMAERLQPVRLDLTLPTKVKDARAVYPASAQASRVQGVVIMEALLDADGKVANARVMRSIPMLDLAALTAVKAWVFTPPTLANGDHVATVITVTVNFALQ